MIGNGNVAEENKKARFSFSERVKKAKDLLSVFKKNKEINVSSAKCGYTYCMLPNHNYQYLFQIFYLTVCAFVLMRDNSNLTFFSMSMYIVPILNDLIFTRLKWPFLNFIRKSLGFFTGVLLVGCILGLANVIIITNEGFVVHNVSFVDVTIPKNWVCISLFAEIMVPIILWAGSPTNKTQAIAEKIVRGALADDQEHSGDD